MGLRFSDIIFALALNFVHIVSCDHILPCTGKVIGECAGRYQFCNVTSNQCGCLEDYVWVIDECLPSEFLIVDHSPTVVVLTVFTLVLIFAGLFLVIRKYNLVEYVRNKINSRRNNDVMYEDVMIGNDDPPLSP